MDMPEPEDPPGVPEWVVTYGDMMSLLLTFFIMLVSLSEVVADKKYRSVMDALQKYVGYRTTAPGPPGENFPLNSLVAELKTLGSYTNDDHGPGGVKTKAIDGDDMRVFRTREGKSVPIGPGVRFSGRSLELNDEAREQLRDIAEQLAGKPNKIEIRAHTSSDPLPPDSPYPDKTMLTYARARVVAEFLADNGVGPDRMRLTAAADIEPPEQGADDQVPNPERVQALLLDAFLDEYVGPRDAVK